MGVAHAPVPHHHRPHSLHNLRKLALPRASWETLRHPHFWCKTGGRPIRWVFTYIFVMAPLAMQSVEVTHLPVGQVGSAIGYGWGLVPMSLIGGALWRRHKLGRWDRVAVQWVLWASLWIIVLAVTDAWYRDQA